MSRSTVDPRATVSERFSVSGVVQGVGFRPFVYRLATEAGLGGSVGNDSTGVFIEVRGPLDAVEWFARHLVADAPPLARITEVTRAGPRSVPSPLAAPSARSATVDSVPAERGGFRIVASEHGEGEGERTLVPPDTATCEECRSELFDPTNRRYGHPFITCTNCGPRYTIITDLPYDRPATTMAGFEMCASCRAEYEDPGDRRYHAQPIACVDCGPRLRLELSGSDRHHLHAPRPGDRRDPITAAAALVSAGGIIAVKGLGGYHLACDATNASAVAGLRDRKHRPDKPFAVMVADLDEARGLGRIGRSEADLLSSPEAPIVLVRARTDSPLADEVAPGNPLIGLLLAYTPVHHLLTRAVGRPLVMTSANRSGEPLATDRAALERLNGCYDAVLDHDRPIAAACDDSVVRVLGDRLLPIRRARGYAPIPVSVPDGPPLVAVGAELKNTFCLADRGRAWVSQHLGDMENLATLTAFETALEANGRLCDTEPRLAVADAHPGYLSSGWARRRSGLEVIEVHHHEAHVAAVMAEAGLGPDTPVVGFAFDGTGYGPDGTIWGGEVLVGTARRFDRFAHLKAVPLPGGDGAITNPWRAALAHLWSAGLPWADTLAAQAGAYLDPVSTFDPVAVMVQQLETGTGCVETTSMGRLFDAVASLVGLRHRISFEAQGAIDLEMAATGAAEKPAGPDNPRGISPGARSDYRFQLGDGGDNSAIGFDPAPVLAAVMDDLEAGIGVEQIALAFHRAVADVVAELAVRAIAAHQADAERPIEAVILTGGVFQNALLTGLCLDRLEPVTATVAGLRCLTHHLVPPNDGGLSLGQAYLGLCRAEDRSGVDDEAKATRS